MDTTLQQIAGDTAGKTILTDLNSREYEHPLDRQALEALEKTPGLPLLVKKINEYCDDRMFRILYVGSYLRIAPNNLPDLHAELVSTCKILDIENIPDFYLKPDYAVGAFTSCVTRPLICINTGCIDQLSENELRFVLGHELGHIKSQHVMYHQMASIAPAIGEIVGAATFGMGGVISTGILIALLNWIRKSEFSADRAGLLACQDIEAATTTMMKIAGVPKRYHTALNYQCFMQQAIEFESIDESVDKFWKIISIMDQTHPWTVMRASELQKYIASGDYERVISREMRQAPAPPAMFCSRCGAKQQPGDRFCRGCGQQFL